MIDGKTLYFYKAKMLRILEQYSGVEAREDQLIQDAQININGNARPNDIRQALGALKDDGFASRRLADLRGAVWRITPAGHTETSRLALEEETD